jgi:AraC-like DNA-binding protein
MMQQTEMRDQNVADALGFCDPQYFSRLFKQVVGSAPREYRKSLP